MCHEQRASVTPPPSNASSMTALATTSPARTLSADHFLELTVQWSPVGPRAVVVDDAMIVGNCRRGRHGGGKLEGWGVDACELGWKALSHAACTSQLMHSLVCKLAAHGLQQETAARARGRASLRVPCYPTPVRLQPLCSVGCTPTHLVPHDPYSLHVRDIHDKYQPIRCSKVPKQRFQRVPILR